MALIIAMLIINSNKKIKDANVEARRIKENAETEALLARQKILNKAEEEAKAAAEAEQKED